MTDLEDLWDEIPTGTPPVDAILTAGRASVARRRTRTRPLIAVGAAVAMAGAFIAGTLIGNPSGSTITPSHGDASPVAFQADLEPAQSCDELLTSYHDRALGLVTQWGWGTEWGGYRGGFAEYSDELTSLSAKDTVRAAAGRQSQSASATGTNVQESSVDEPDTVKTDGKLVVRLRGSNLLTYDASGTTMVEKSKIHLSRVEDGEILLSGTNVVVIGSDQVSPRDEMTGMRRGSRVVTVSLAKPSKPTIESTVTYSSRIISARQHGSTVRLVLAAGLPALDFVQPEGKKVTKRQALVTNRRVVEESTIDDWLPTYNTGVGPKQLLDCTKVAIPPDSLGLDTVSIVGFTATAPTTPHAIGLAGAATIAYESANHLYLADGVSQWDCRMCRFDGAAKQQVGGTTHLYDFELDGVNAIHVASGEVEGTIKDRWSLDEADDVLRVAVGPSSETGNFNSVVTFRRKGQDLVEIGRLDQLGKNEDLKAVRWFDDLAVIVTYREVDPLFTIDLADPAKPRLIGKLKIPGYSDYLHPLGNDEMLGIGYHEGNSWGAQIALFDISDLAKVKQVDVEHYRDAEAIATWEPRAFTWLPEHDTALTVLQKGSRVKLATLKVSSGQLSSTLTNVEYGSDADQVRTLGLPDGRVVLVTGEDVHFFTLP